MEIRIETEAGERTITLEKDGVRMTLTEDEANEVRLRLALI